MFIKRVEGCASGNATSSTSLRSFGADRKKCAEDAYISFTIKIGNIDDILKCYGAVSVDRIVQAVASVISRLDSRVGVDIAADHQLDVALPREQFAEDVPLAAACEAWLCQVARSVALIPFWTEWGVVHVWLSGRWSAQTGGATAGSDWLLAFSGDPVAAPEAATARYRRDMVLASKLLCPLAGAEAGAMDGGALRIAWRPVIARASGEVLYYQSTVRFEEALGDPWLARNALAVVERIGFGAILDEIVLRETVAALEADSRVVLSASIASVGVVGSPWWRLLAARLEQRPDIAARLVLEICEAAPLAKSAEMGRFCDEARRLGCRIAISGFGAGFASVRQLAAVGPDIVKLDCGFVRRSTTSPRDRAILAGLGQLAAAVASIVVADGVDTFAQAQLADELGLAWQQGHFWGGVSTCRPWCGARASAEPAPVLLAG